MLGMQHCCYNCECGVDPVFSEALENNKVEAIVNEYNELLTAQLENEKMRLKKKIKRQASEAVQKALIQNHGETLIGFGLQLADLWQSFGKN
nr:BRCA1-associated protein [Ipomoea batatas]